MKKFQTSRARATVGGATSWNRKIGGTVSTMPAPLVLNPPTITPPAPEPLVLI